MKIDSSLTTRSLLKTTGIQEVLDYEGITEVAINQGEEIWFDRGNGWEVKEAPECTYSNLNSLARSLTVFSGLKTAFDDRNPIASVILPDGERGQIITAPATECNTISFTLRKPSLKRFTVDDYQNSGRFTNIQQAEAYQKGTIPLYMQEMRKCQKEGRYADFFRIAAANNMNVIAVGGTGSGKTTFAKAYADLIPHNHRLITIEDVHEVTLPYHKNHLHLFFDPDYQKSRGISPKELIKSAMRMKPDHILLTELRGDETWNYFEALNTGHNGSITSTHANDVSSTLARLTALVVQSEMGKVLSETFISKTIASALDVTCFFKHTYMTEILFEPEKKLELIYG
ncbi:P-type DNA transfer ATPase VirB11 [Rodentibacter caecimuris]|uniref:P-type DNA transfer ATPase VirB11 n=1 Tax=Rodentibacter caecimuris TaxID=1796644 RepID=UPI00211A73D7|nr:P-type DNA transfer ATPase VirB11 [Rodentibacter heylii]MCQ9124689.1 P-type DNA transfer ATPase VirB11 [Rodentibacter heylii]